MGVHDYRCSTCGTPAAFTCGEAVGQACRQEGIGSDEAVLDLFFFSSEDAPTSAEEFEGALSRALRVETRPFAYDWGEWEFKPSLNYRQLLIDDDDQFGIWSIQPFDGDLGDGSPVSLDIPANEQVWVVNYCLPCRRVFVDQQAPAEEPCAEYLKAIADNLGLAFRREGGSAAKALFLEEVRARVALRRPAKR